MNFNQSFISRIFFHFVFKINNWTVDYIKKLYALKQYAIDKKWNEKFSETPFFIHRLSRGLKIKLYRDSILSKLIFEGFEEAELKYIESTLRQGDIFIDVGSNIGYFSLYASRLVGPQGKVISLEPSVKTYERLLENITLNELINLTPLNIGLSDKKGQLELQISDSGYDAWNTFSNVSDNKFHRKINVSVDTLDNLVQDYNKQKIRFIKIDVEGWEKFVLLGGINFLTSHSPLLMIEFTEANTLSAGYIVHDLFDILEKIGYEWFSINNGNLIPEIKKTHYPYENLIARKRSC